MKTWKTFECFYSSLELKLNEISRDGWEVMWIFNPANNANLMIVCYKEFK